MHVNRKSITQVNISNISATEEEDHLFWHICVRMKVSQFEQSVEKMKVIHKDWIEFLQWGCNKSYMYYYKDTGSTASL